jgi:hypothetical protein
MNKNKLGMNGYANLVILLGCGLDVLPIRHFGVLDYSKLMMILILLFLIKLLAFLFLFQLYILPI